MDSISKGVYALRVLKKKEPAMSSCRSSGFFCLMSLLSSLGWSKSCEDLLSESIANVSVTESRIVLAGEFDSQGVLRTPKFMRTCQNFVGFHWF